MKRPTDRFYFSVPHMIAACILLVFQMGCAPDNTVDDPDFHLPEGYTIEPIVDPSMISFPMFATFDDRGRLFLFEATEPNDMSTDSMVADPTYHIRLLTDTDQDGTFDQSVIYADEIPFPMGGTFHDGSLYAAAPPDVLKLTDTNDDGIADDREVLLTGWTLYNNGAILSGPYMGPDGWMYVSDARRGFDITTKEGERIQGKGTRIWRFLPDGSRLEWVSGGGFDNAIEIDFMPGGDPIGTMTYFRDPANGERDALMHWVYGGVYPKYNAVIDEDDLTMTGELMPVVTKMPRVAPAGIVRMRGDRWGTEYEGEWFSAIFNTGQVLRHHISVEGGSYRSEDEVFLSSELADFHPTDVLQDGNGDLLVIVTGGWFIKGCPLSRVAKPDVPGGVYRIRKNGNTRYQDPWGTSIDFKNKSTDGLANLLDDERPMVRQNAIQALEKKGVEAVEVFSARYRNVTDMERLEMLYALHRLQLKEGSVLVREGLKDEMDEIRIAAARLCGLSKDEEAVPALLDMVQLDSSLRARRQAATALGQIGNTVAVPVLLQASSGVDDRFLLHAIRYALITLDQPAPVIRALQDDDPDIRMTALVVLDQMESSPLRANHVRPFLTSEDEELQETGIWVMGHHPEWATTVTDFIDAQLAEGDLNDTAIRELVDLLVTFCGNTEIQTFVGKTLKATATEENIRLGMLRVMEQCTGQVPKGWIPILDQQLQSPSEIVQSAAIRVIETRQITALESRLTDLLPRNADHPDRYLRILNARLASDTGLSEDEFDRVGSFLDTTYSVNVRRSALQVLGRANLTLSQLTLIGQSLLPASDATTFPGLVSLYDADSMEQTGLLLVEGMEQKESYLNAFTEEQLGKILENYPESVRKAAEPVLETLRQQNAERWDQLHHLEDGLVKGDIGRGRDLFFGKAICSTCHAVGQEGHTFGPDLTTIGAIRSRHDLLEAIVFPSVSFAREYETFVVTTTDKTYTGILKEGLESGIVVIEQAPGVVIRIPEDEILSMEAGEVSLMPAGLDRSLSNQELSDLIAFLEALPYTVDRLIELGK